MSVNQLIPFVFITLVIVGWWLGIKITRHALDPNQEFKDVPLPAIVSLCLLALSGVIMFCVSYVLLHIL